MEYRPTGDNHFNPEEEASSRRSPKMALTMAAPQHPSPFRRDTLWEQPRVSNLSVRPRSDEERVALPSIRQVT